MTDNQQPFCSDPSYDLQGLRFVDAIKPCPQLALSVPTLFALQIFIFLLFGYFKKRMMRWMGIEEKDIHSILSSRRILPVEVKDDAENCPISATGASNEVDDDDQDKPIGFSLEYLIEKYGDKKLRYVDSIPRKTGHLIGITIMFLQIQFTTNRVLTQLQTLSLASSILAAMFVFFNNYWIDSWFACHLFALSRIRDGTYGRINLCVAVPTAAIGTVVVLFTIMYGIVLHVENPSLQILIVNLIYAPLIVGDAMGELIGGPFGGTFFPTFPVQGFGEINRKSIEGCTAVFCGSLVGCVATCYLYGASTSSWILLGLALSLITTLVETAAFRSTDNFLIPVVNAGVVLLALGPFGDSFNQ